jgi:hypothetical protein
MCIYPFIAFHSWWTGGADCGYGPVATIVLLLIVAVLHIMNGVNYNEEAIGNYHRVLARVRRRRRIAPMWCSGPRILPPALIASPRARAGNHASQKDAAADALFARLKRAPTSEETRAALAEMETGAAARKAARTGKNRGVAAPAAEAGDADSGAKQEKKKSQ